MTTERARDGWLMALQWTLATTAGAVVGVLVGSLLAVPVMLTLQNSPGSKPMATALFALLAGFLLVLASIGTSVATTQWLVLRRWLPRSGAWLITSPVGFAVGTVAGISGWLPLSEAFARSGWSELVVSSGIVGAVIGAAIGASVGALQCSVLAEQVRRVGWWVLASTLGMSITGAVLGGVVGAHLEPRARQVRVEPTILLLRASGAVAVGWAVYGAITGITLACLLRHSGLEASVVRSGGN